MYDIDHNIISRQKHEHIVSQRIAWNVHRNTHVETVFLREVELSEVSDRSDD